MKIIPVLVLSAFLFLSPAIHACPMCKDAIAASNQDDEPNLLPAAFNQSILFMLGVPYTVLGIGGFLIYRGVKKNAAFLEAVKATKASG